VPVDIVVPEGRIGVILSGPNTGGKTVTLKTIGLFAALLKIGAPVPAVDAQLPLYNRILMDIGDQQSIESSLSTFASHIARLKVIVEEADSGDLVLIDELGSGTDPDEGAAIAEAVVDFLVASQCPVFHSHSFVASKDLSRRPERNHQRFSGLRHREAKTSLQAKHGCAGKVLCFGDCAEVGHA